MADLPPTSHSKGEAGHDAGVRPGLGSPPSTPRWVKVFGIIALVLLPLFVILHLTGNSPFGPGGHTIR